MKNIIISSLLVGLLIVTLNAKDNNSTKEEITKKQVQEQMEREKKYAKEQTFYQGSDYNLSAVEVDKKSLDRVPTLEPDYDFDMDSVYSDIQ